MIVSVIMTYYGESSFRKSLVETNRDAFLEGERLFEIIRERRAHK